MLLAKALIHADMAEDAMQADEDAMHAVLPRLPRTNRLRLGW
jgi:hypothetical protein